MLYTRNKATWPKKKKKKTATTTKQKKTADALCLGLGTRIQNNFTPPELEEKIS